MSRIDSFLTDSFPLSDFIDDADPGVDTARVIGDKSTSITVVRGGSELAAQTVRLEPLPRPVDVQRDDNTTAKATVLVIGYKGHPTITDTDLQTGDRFAVDGQSLEIIMVQPGLNNTLQAYAKVRS